MKNLLDDAHRDAKEKNPKSCIQVTNIETKMVKANDEFSEYQRCLLGLSQDDIGTVIERYQKARNEISKEMCVFEHNKWKTIVTDSNPKQFWKHIDWKGNMAKKQIEQPLIEDLSTHFEDLYSLTNKDELIDMSNLESNVYIPLLDDPITAYDINAARKSMKKAGYDFALSTLDIVLKVLSPVLLMLLNIMFYVSYPASLATSLLTAIPKKGNLKFFRNYSGIQMQPTLGVLFDRILANRLSNWVGVQADIVGNRKSHASST